MQGGETTGAFSHQEHVVGPIHDLLGHQGRRLHSLKRRHGSSLARWSVHHCRIELDFTVEAGKTAVSYCVVRRVELNDVHPGDGSIYRILSREQPAVGRLHGC